MRTVQNITAVWSVEVQNLTAGVIQLAESAAVSWFAMRAAAAQDGLALTIYEPGGGYRSVAMQQSMWKYRAMWNIGAGIRLAPVGQSTHQGGLNADIKYVDKAGSAQRRWVDANAGRFGWVHRDVAGDPACMHYRGGYTSPASTNNHEIEGLLMALSDGQQQAIYDLIVGSQQTAFASRLADVLLDRAVARSGGATGSTSLRGVLAWSDSHVVDTQNLIKGIKASGTAQVDAAAVAKAIVAELGPTISGRVADELSKRLGA